ncbi:MAG TPA: hypothetical protein PKO18_02420 [Chitinophagales bacterium]|nr:hypothetical protein [Chitinophagales bacterium]HNL84062.1 hypothetical protein [Chitinophagales bacterium]
MRNLLLIFSIISLLITSCTCNRNPEQQKQPKKSVEKQKEDIHVHIIRFDRELFAANPNDIENEINKYKAKYPLFFPVYYNNVLSLPSAGDKSKQMDVMREFVSSASMRGLYDSVQHTFPDLKFLEDDLNILFTNYTAYFPKKIIPHLFTCISEFSYSVFTAGDSMLAFSLDKYLGARYLYYPAVFPEITYLYPTFDKKYIAIDGAQALASNIVPPPSDRSTLLDKMLAEGKILYLMQAFLPDKKPNDIIKYSDKQWKWCNDNEQQIWSYFIEKKLLYDTRFEQFKYVKDGPYTYGMPKESPGKVGAWVGWKIVQAFMREHPDYTVQQLLDEKDGQKMLTESMYKPKV